MFSSYAKIAWRNVVGNPLFSTINIVGLAIGLACCIIITVFVRYELSYDKHWTDADRTYRVTRDFFGNNLRLASVAPPIAPLLSADFQEVEATTRLLQTGQVTLIRGDQRFREDSLVIADGNVFEFFDLRFIEGDATSALARPSDLVLTERAAARYFGNENPVGQTLNLMGQVDLTITGVIENLPDNTHMAFELVGSIAAAPMVMGENELEDWGSNNYYTYVRLPPGYDHLLLQQELPAFLDKHLRENSSDDTRLGLQPITSIHLRSNLDAEWRSNGSAAVVYSFSAVALAVLLIACINFMNLTTARSMKRAREVGIRKVVGASRQQLIAQFLGESVLLTSIAMFLAVALVELAMPVVGAFLDKPLTFSLANPATLFVLLVGLLLVGLSAGSYPAFYLSRFRPFEVLKGNLSGGGSAILRQGLVVFQFAMSVALLIATGVIVAQMSYVKNYDLGYDRSRNIVARLPFFADLWSVYEPIKAELESHPDILSVVYSSRLPGQQNLDGSGYVPEGTQVTLDSVQGLADIKVDYQWFEHYDVPFLAGRTFRENERRIQTPSEENPVVRGAAILNESAARRFGWSPDEAINKVLRQPLSRDLDRFVDRQIVGVIPDIHISSLHDEVKATVYAEPNANYGRSISIKLAAGDFRAAIDHFESVWARIVPDEPADWEFLDARFDALYRAEERQATMFAVFAAFAIFVATLGLFGLASFTTERRTKEIGIRKVMGASASDIVLLLTSDFSKLVLLANLIAWPLAFWLMQKWLSRFAYAAPVAEWAWLFVASGLVALAVAWLTIALQASRAARARPILALRYE